MQLATQTTNKTFNHKVAHGVNSKHEIWAEWKLLLALTRQNGSCKIRRHKINFVKLKLGKLSFIPNFLKIPIEIKLSGIAFTQKGIRNKYPFSLRKIGRAHV